ncbi:MAG TPA: hypothetical protein VHY10_19005 [Xanthobacteraceae bacterium]|nr:hypothetical protein [Xanthobacteraceae bacterium]
MGYFEQFVPITVLAAVCLFIAREILEFIRRRNANGRRTAAIKTMLARELELNNWTITRLQMTFDDIRDNEGHTDLLVSFSRRGQVFYKTKKHDHVASWPIPEVHSDVLSKHILDIATLDSTLFRAAQTAYDATAELLHIRESLVQALHDEDPDIPQDLESFVEYARRVVEQITPDFADLYRQCTGKPFDAERIR